jgi:hypothetical protein
MRVRTEMPVTHATARGPTLSQYVPLIAWRGCISGVKPVLTRPLACTGADVWVDGRGASGWYNEREEAFVTELEAKQSDYKDPTSGASGPLESSVKCLSFV